jgi:hypothetical protein
MKTFTIYITEEVVSRAYINAETKEEAEKYFNNNMEDIEITEVLRENYAITAINEARKQ